MECIRSGMSLAGDMGSEVIIYHIKTRLGMEDKDVAREPEKFAWALEAMLGDSARPIFRAIMSELLARLPSGPETMKLAAALSHALAGDSSGKKLYLAPLSLEQPASPTA